MSIEPEIEVQLDEHPAHHIEWTLASGGLVRLGFSVKLHGWNATETSGSASATVNMYDGTDTTGSIVIPINLAQSESASDWYDRGIWFKNGVYINMGSGAAKGAVFYRHYRP